MKVRVDFFTTYQSQIELLPRFTIIYDKEVNEMGCDYVIALEWLWFSLMITCKMNE